MITKDELLNLLEKFLRQKSGLDPRDYGGSREALMGDVNKIRTDSRDAHRLIQACRASRMDAQEIIDASLNAYSGRLEIELTETGAKISYCTGQYFPTEFKAAVCSVLATALWTYYVPSWPRHWHRDEIHAAFHRLYGRAIADRWFK